jgi:hypothetical protein
MAKVLAGGLALLLAATSAAPAAELVYDVYVGGVRLVETRVSLDLGADTYDISLDAALVGIAADFGDWRSDVRSEGRLDGIAPAPRRNIVARMRNGATKTTTMDFRGAGVVDIAFDPPPDKPKPQMVPASALVAAVDPLSGVVGMLAAAAEARCGDRPVPLYDGRRLYEASLSDGGEVMLARSEFGLYGGPARRCTVTLEPKLGDFSFGDERRGGRPTEYLQGNGRIPDRRVLETWMASPVPGVPPVPVRMESDSPWGRIVIHLRQARP